MCVRGGGGGGVESVCFKSAWAPSHGCKNCVGSSHVLHVRAK